jgi:hypothetical protein
MLNAEVPRESDHDGRAIFERYVRPHPVSHRACLCLPHPACAWLPAWACQAVVSAVRSGRAAACG